MALAFHRCDVLCYSFFQFRQQQLVVVDGVLRSAEGREDRPDVVDPAEVGIDGGGAVLRGLENGHEVVLGQDRHQSRPGEGVARFADRPDDVEGRLLGPGIGLDHRHDIVMRVVQEHEGAVVGRVQRIFLLGGSHFGC